jgi:hypothetical protein
LILSKHIMWNLAHIYRHFVRPSQFWSDAIAVIVLIVEVNVSMDIIWMVAQDLLSFFKCVTRDLREFRSVRSAHMERCVWSAYKQPMQTRMKGVYMFTMRWNLRGWNTWLEEFHTTILSRNLTTPHLTCNQPTGGFPDIGTAKANVSLSRFLIFTSLTYISR